MATKFANKAAMPAAALDARAAPRHPALVTRALARRRRAKPVEAAIMDISVYGCRILIDGEDNPDDRIWITIGSAKPVAASIVWANEGKIGCRFDKPISRQMVRAVTLGI